MPHRDMLEEDQIRLFIREHQLPSEFKELITDHYEPLAAWLLERRVPGQALLLGINGGQGTGKSTLADYLKRALHTAADWRVAVLSIDDFYLTREARKALAKEVHPMLAVRGVPGTHDLPLLSESLKYLKDLKTEETLPLPRFDKALDDRRPTEAWPKVKGPIDLIVLEGWCVGSVAQAAAELAKPVNTLEEERDPDGVWRKYVNRQLAGPYAKVFSTLDKLIFLQIPSFDAVYRWRLEQEQKLAAKAGDTGTRVMSESEIAQFVQYYERITRSNLEELPQRADVLFKLDEGHGIVSSHYRG